MACRHHRRPPASGTTRPRPAALARCSGSTCRAMRRRSPRVKRKRIYYIYYIYIYICIYIFHSLLISKKYIKKWKRCDMGLALARCSGSTCRGRRRRSPKLKQIGTVGIFWVFDIRHRNTSITGWVNPIPIQGIMDESNNFPIGPGKAIGYSRREWMFFYPKKNEQKNEQTNGSAAWARYSGSTCACAAPCPSRPLCIYESVYMHVYLYIYIYIWSRPSYRNMFICIYTYIYMYIYNYVHM